MHTPAVASPAIRLRVAEFRRRARRDGLTADGEIAARIGVHRITVSRMLKGEITPGQTFIAAVLAAFPEKRFEDLFEVPQAAASGSSAA